MTVKRETKDGMNKRMSILLVEDDFSTTVTMARAFRELGQLDGLLISMDCAHALSRLRDPGIYRPDLILLDLNMPCSSALQMLRELKNNPVSRLIPVVILAETSDDQDVSDCYGLGAAGYMLKSDEFDVLVEKIRAVCSYWAMSRLPVAN